MIYPQINTCEGFGTKSTVLHSNDLLMEYMDSFELVLEDKILDKYSTVHDENITKESLIQVILKINEAARVLNYHSNQSIASNRFWDLSDSFNKTLKDMISSFSISMGFFDSSYILKQLAEKNLKYTNLDGSHYQMFNNPRTYPLAAIHIKRFFPNIPISEIKYWFEDSSIFNESYYENYEY